MPHLPRSAIAFAVAVAATQLPAQDWGPARVGVTAAVEAEVQATIRLPGTVEAATHAIVASEEAGVVAEIRVREGSQVRRGATLARLRRETLERDLEAARGQLTEAEARLELAVRSRRRSGELHAAGVISRQQLDDAESEASAWQGRVDQATALIGRLETQLRRSDVRAPFSGFVVRELCDVGEWVAAGGPVVEMFDPASLGVVVQMPERHFGGLRNGTRASIRLDALPERDFGGAVVAIIPRADAQARTFPVKIGFADRDDAVGLGMTATVAMPTGDPRPATVVPKDAIVSQGAQRLVYRVDQGPPGSEGGPTEIATAVPVVVGAGVGEWIEVQGIEPGSRIVTRGNERLAPGSQLITEPVEYALP